MSVFRERSGGGKKRKQKLSQIFRKPGRISDGHNRGNPHSLGY